MSSKELIRVEQRPLDREASSLKSAWNSSIKTRQGASLRDSAKIRRSCSSPSPIYPLISFWRYLTDQSTVTSRHLSIWFLWTNSPTLSPSPLQVMFCLHHHQFPFNTYLPTCSRRTIQQSSHRYCQFVGLKDRRIQTRPKDKLPELLLYFLMTWNLHNNKRKQL